MCKWKWEMGRITGNLIKRFKEFGKVHGPCINKDDISNPDKAVVVLKKSILKISKYHNHKHINIKLTIHIFSRCIPT